MRAGSLLVLLAAAAPALAQAERDPIEIKGQAGWGGRVSRGDWAPIAVDVDNRSPKDLEGTLVLVWAHQAPYQKRGRPGPESLEGRTGPRHEIPLAIAATARKRHAVSLIAPDGDSYSLWAFFISPKGKILGSGELFTTALEAKKRLVAIVGQDRPEGLDLPDLVTVGLAPERLPEDWRGYAALEALIWLDGKATEMRSPAQLEALRAWVSSGGRLVVARANDVGIGGTPLMKLLPVRTRGGKEVDGLEGLAAVPGASGAPQGRTMILESSLLRGHAPLLQDGIPLVVESAHDAGRVTFVAFDPSRTPFTQWKEARRFWSWLLQAPPRPDRGPNPEELATPRAPRILGSATLAQLAATFPDVAPPAIGGLFLLILLYLAVVGPGDYFLLRSLRRLELTWITFPVYVVAFTGLILLIGGAFMRTAAHQRETRVVDHFLETESSRERSIAAVLAPAHVSFRFEDAEPISQDFLSRTLYRGTGTELAALTVTHGRTREVREWILQRGATGLAAADRVAQAPPPLTYSIEAEGDGCSVTVRNTGGVPYEAAMLVTPRGVYAVGSLPAGESRHRASKRHASARAWADAEGARPVRATPEERYGARWGDEQQERISERQLNDQVRKFLLGMSFPPRERPAAEEDLTGMAQSLDATRWIESGGSALFAWSWAGETSLRFAPDPARKTSLTLSRFFLGPKP
jgi:hypothetical protein